MAVQTSAGATLEVVAAQPATNDLAGYQALSFTNVGEISDMAAFGAQYELVTFNDIGSRTTRKYKGTVNYGSMQLTLGRDPADAGQAILIEGADGTEIDTTHSFKATLQDGEIQYFQGKIMGYDTQVGAANNIVSSNCPVELESTILRDTP